MLRPIDKPTALSGTQPGEPGERLVLAEGEATGHAHVLTGLAVAHTVVTNFRRMAVIEVHEPSALTHQEHKTIRVPPGWYEIIRQRVYTPTSPRFVRD